MAGPAIASPAGATNNDSYFWHVQSQPFVQSWQQLWSHLQSGQPSQQLLWLQQPLLHPAVDGVDAANASPLAASMPNVAKVQSDLVNMVSLTF